MYGEHDILHGLRLELVLMKASPLTPDQLCSIKTLGLSRLTMKMSAELP